MSEPRDEKNFDHIAERLRIVERCEHDYSVRDRFVTCLKCGNTYIRSNPISYVLSYAGEGLTMAEYQAIAATTNRYTECTGPIPYLVMGLCDKAGEVAGKVKKIFRDKGGQVSAEDIEAVKYELGDVLWYLSQLASAIGCTLEEVAWANAQKLESRAARGVIGGSGDMR
jgi:NTP pyrophosphatase (non-canonical NTP hydrolase)